MVGSSEVNSSLGKMRERREKKKRSKKGGMSGFYGTIESGSPADVISAGCLLVK
jgi:hypothetical protein